MSGAFAPAGMIDSLSDEQRLAAGIGRGTIFIEAGPGTGKTTVSAHRFGVQRFAPESRHDPRAVVAVSFTRAATSTLRRRVQLLWGLSALAWPHRIITLDTVMSDLLHDLLRTGRLRWPDQATIWPDGNVQLDVHDSWASFSSKVWNRTIYNLTIENRQIAVNKGFSLQHSSSFPNTETVPRLLEGTCTHEDVRTVLELAMNDAECRKFVRQRLSMTMRALVVDEVFDANDLDIAIIEAAMDAGVAVTLVGDPWQALYAFRGARPETVPDLISRTSIPTLPLTQSFRWRTDSQRDLALALRQGDGVVLKAEHDIDQLDVVLALQWKQLWELGAGSLPLAFHGFKGGNEEAATTLLLNHVTRSVLDLDATYLTDAMTVLAIQDRDVPRQLEPGLQQVTEVLREGDKESLKQAYYALIDVVKTASPRVFKPAHPAYTKRLAQIHERLVHPARPVLGLTTHQAKGREWASVGLRLTEMEKAELAGGLTVDKATHRQLYVACTRAQIRTVEARPLANNP